MATLLQNASLGWAGLEDELFGGNRAAKVFAEQTSAATGQDRSALESQAIDAEKAGAVDRAAQATRDQIAAGAKEAIDTGTSLIKWVAIGAAAIAIVVVIAQGKSLLKG